MIKRFFVWYLTKKYLRWVSEDDVLTETKEGIFHKDKLLNKDQAAKLADDAYNIRHSYLWKVLSDEIQYVAQITFVQAKNYDETLSAKLLLRAREIIEKKLAYLESLRKSEK